ncbi:hypothetical protein L228DRAFT_269468 [Xylona heveae TC161]|uniref:Uncharacterized protein n=1 Tax=Xylona heveae (strain CBS 132557 / TC161) TaxID=1328760 RepID=A0A165FJZ8_XYLHT|nr:hypothetical protein L228DRAFT_269468 [Xylona heveae TC161]KZF21066.1 hypothetical protein L228DRAFT_269468 [Xylona heveae TC161]
MPIPSSLRCIDKKQDAVVEDARVAVTGLSKPLSATTLAQLTSSAEACKDKRKEKAEASLDEALRAHLKNNPDSINKK